MGEISENIESNPKRKFTIVVVVVVLFIIALLISVWVWGRHGIAMVLTGFIILLIIMSVLFLLAFLAIKLIFPPKPNMLSILKTRLGQGASMRTPDREVKVYLAGDNKDYERRYLGLLRGISETVIPPEMEKEGNTLKAITKAERFLFLMVKKSLFSEERIVGVLRNDISNPSMDEVYIKDRTLTPPFGGVYFPSKYSEQSKYIEAPITSYVKRYTLEGFLKDLKVMMDDAVQSNPEHQKRLEQKGVFERIGEVGEND